jgi:F0F1-type ATP synthase alpha subunit
MDYTIIVDASAAAGGLWCCPYAGCAMGEYFATTASCAFTMIYRSTRGPIEPSRCC